MSVVSVKSLAGDLINLFKGLDEAVALSEGKSEKNSNEKTDREDEPESDAISLQRLIDNPDISCFPCLWCSQGWKEYLHGVSNRRETSP
jgi:hypothetical protein